MSTIISSNSRFKLCMICLMTMVLALHNLGSDGQYLNLLNKTELSSFQYWLQTSIKSVYENQTLINRLDFFQFIFICNFSTRFHHIAAFISYNNYTLIMASIYLRKYINVLWHIANRTLWEFYNRLFKADAQVTILLKPNFSLQLFWIKCLIQNTCNSYENHYGLQTCQ